VAANKTLLRLVERTDFECLGYDFR